MNKKKWIGIVLAGAAVCLILVMAAGSFLGVKAEKAQAVKGAVADYYTEEGVLKSGKEYQLIAEVSGPVSEILVSENVPVKKGDLLAVIGSTEIPAMSIENIWCLKKIWTNF